MPATAVLLSKIAELEASLQSTENYWKSKYQLEVDKVAELERRLSDETAWEEHEQMLTNAATAKIKDLQSQLDGFKSICNEYLCGPEASWQDLSNWCEDKTDEIVGLKDEVEDLEEEVADLKEKYEVNIDQSEEDQAEKIEEIQSFLKVCDRNSDGHYEHYETRQIATRLEGGVYQKS